MIAIPDPKWQERPLVCIVLKPGAGGDGSAVADGDDDGHGDGDGDGLVEKVHAHLLAGGFARWQLPDRVEVIDAVPRTSVGKFDKKALRARFG